MKHRYAIILAAVLFALGIGAYALWGTDDSSGPPPPKPSPTASPSPTATPAPSVAPPAGDLQTLPPVEGDTPKLKDETPAGVPQEKLDEGAKEAEKAEEGLPAKERPVGGAQNYSCPEDHKGNVWSSRNGAKVQQFVLHYTVSANVPGKGDVLGIRDYFARTRVGSATWIIDFEGNCIETVPPSMKPWTQGWFNPWSESVEIIATGRETRAQWLASPLIRDGILSSLVRDHLKARGLPLRRVDPVGCLPGLGVTDHNALECGMNHTDVAPNFPWDVFMNQLRDAPAKTGIDSLLKGERVFADCLLKERKIAKRNGGWEKVAPNHLRRATECKDGLRRANDRLHAAGISNGSRIARHAFIHQLL